MSYRYLNTANVFKKNCLVRIIVLTKYLIILDLFEIFYILTKNKSGKIFLYYYYIKHEIRFRIF